MINHAQCVKAHGCVAREEEQPPATTACRQPRVDNLAILTNQRPSRSPTKQMFAYLVAAFFFREADRRLAVLKGLNPSAVLEANKQLKQVMGNKPHSCRAGVPHAKLKNCW